MQQQLRHPNVSMYVQVYAGPLKGGSRAVVFFNRHAQGTQYPLSNITVTWRQLGYDADVKGVVRDLHAEKDLGTFTEGFTGAVDIHDARVLRITPQDVRPEYDSWRPWSDETRALQASVRGTLQPTNASSRHRRVSARQ